MTTRQVNQPKDNEIPNGFKKTEIGLIPEDWEVVKLEDIAEFRNGLWKGRKEPLIKVFVLRNTNFNNDGTISFKDVAELYVEEAQYKTRKLKYGDILLERSGGGPTQPVGRVVFFNIKDREDKNYSFSNFTTRIRIITQNKLLNKYLFYFLLNFYFKGKTKELQNRTTGIRNLDFSRYKKISVSFPPIPEQKKIAYVLSTIQEAKEKTEAVIKAAKELKKSLMKYLFTYGPVPLNEAENVKLKETEIGLIPEEWDIVKLENIVKKSYSGGTPSTTRKEYWGGEIPWTTSAVIKEEDIYLRGFQRTITKLALKSSATKIAPKGSLLVGTRVGVGKAVVALFDVAINQDITVLELDNERILPIFMAYFFKTESIQNWFENNKRGATIKGIPRKDLLYLLIPLPPLPIQQKIASILSAVDEKIEKEENKKKALEELFKSMLHNLMTGKVRVKDLDIEVEMEGEEKKDLEVVDENVGK